MTDTAINTKNRFALGLEDEEDTDLYELLNQEEEKKKQKAQEAAEAAKLRAVQSKGKKDKRITSAKSNTKKVLSKSSDNTSNTQQQSSRQTTSYDSNNPSAKKSFNNYDNRRENQAPRFRTQNRSPNDENVNFERNPQENRREGGEFRSRGGRGGTRGAFRGGPRRYDRHSGSDKTGVKAVEKRDGFGAHNWGDEISSQLEQPQTEEPKEGEQKEGEQPTATAEGEETQAEGAEEAPKEAKEEDPEAKYQTLEEYRAQNARMKPVFSNTRRPNEGTDTKQWKKTVALEKKKKGDHSDDEYEEYTDEEVEDAKSDLEKLNIHITFGDRRGRGGRGRGMGRGGRGGRFSDNGDFREGGYGSRSGSDRRGGGNKKNVPQIDNENFPSLGGR